MVESFEPPVVDIAGFEEHCCVLIWCHGYSWEMAGVAILQLIVTVSTVSIEILPIFHSASGRDDCWI